MKSYDGVIGSDGIILALPEFYEKYNKHIGTHISNKSATDRLKDINDKSGVIDNKKLSNTSMKPLITALDYNEANKQFYSLGIKSSIFAIPENLGGKYKTIIDFMRNNKIELLVFSSAVKFGENTLTVDLFNDNDYSIKEGVLKKIILKTFRVLTCLI